MENVFVEKEEFVVSFNGLALGRKVTQDELENVPQSVHFGLGLCQESVPNQDGGVLRGVGGHPPSQNINAINFATYQVWSETHLYFYS